MLENDEIMTVGKAAKYVNRTVNTLQRWDRIGKLKAHQTQKLLLPEKELQKQASIVIANHHFKL